MPLLLRWTSSAARFVFVGRKSEKSEKTASVGYSVRLEGKKRNVFSANRHQGHYALTPPPPPSPFLSPNHPLSSLLGFSLDNIQIARLSEGERFFYHVLADGCV